MNQPAPHLFHPHHWHVHETIVSPPPVDVVRNPDIPIIHAFRIAAGAYLAVTIAAVALFSFGVIDPGVVGGRFVLCAGIGLVAAALSFVGGIMYGLPHVLGGSLWSVRLAWSHFVALNVAVLLPLWYLIFNRTLAELASTEILAVVVTLHAGAIGTFILNLVESAVHFDLQGKK